MCGFPGFSPWKLIWAAGSTLDAACLGRSSTPWKPKAGGKNEEGIIRTRAASRRRGAGSQRWKGLGGSGVHHVPVPGPVPDWRWTCGNRTPWLTPRSGFSWKVQGFAPSFSARPASARRKPAPTGAASQSSSSVPGYWPLPRCREGAREIPRASGVLRVAGAMATSSVSKVCGGGRPLGLHSCLILLWRRDESEVTLSSCPGSRGRSGGRSWGISALRLVEANFAWGAKTAKCLSVSPRRRF